MIYAAACIWLLIAVLLAWGVYQLWASMLRPRILDVLLFPGTAVAHFGRTVGLLLTGAKFNPKAAAPPDRKDPKPFEGNVYEPSLPVFGPLVVGLIPLVFVMIALWGVLTRMGGPVLQAVPGDQIVAEMPGTLSVFWKQLRGMITLAEQTLDALRNAEMVNWRVGILTYLLISLTVRLSPFRGNAAGLFGSILVLGAVTALIGTLSTRPAQLIQNGWPVFCLTLGILVLLMMGSLLARGVYLTVRSLAKLT